MIAAERSQFHYVGRPIGTEDVPGGRHAVRLKPTFVRRPRVWEETRRADVRPLGTADQALIGEDGQWLR